MLKLIKHLKPFIASIICAIILLFVQAGSDLALPDYVSNIVNVGIQQGGIENSVPQAIRSSEMNKLTLFVNKNDKVEIMKNYKLIDKSSSDYNEYVKKYPKLKDEPIYALKNIDKSETDKMNPIIGKAFLSVSGVDNLKSTAKNGFINFNGQKIPANTDLFAMFSKLPEPERAKISSYMSEKFTSMGDSMIVQAAASSVKSEYASLGMNTDKIQNKYIIHTGIIMLLISLLSAACTIIVGFIAARVAAGVSRNLRRNIFTKVESFSSKEFDEFSTASLITRTTNDITQIQQVLFLSIRLIIYAPILGIGGVIKAVGKSPSMTWIIALGVIVLLGFIITVFAIAFPKFKLIQKMLDKLNLITRENLSGMMVIRAFNTQKFEEKRFDNANKELTDTNLFVNRVMSIMFPAMMFIMNGITVLIVWVGSHQIANSNMQVGDMMAFMQYAMQIMFAFLMMSFMFIMIPRASASAQRIDEVLKTKLSILDPKKPKKLDGDVKGLVEFRNVSFKYDGAEEYALKDIDFKALPGQTTAFIGSTGSGKSALINLIPRFYDVTDGQILIDGMDIRDITQHDLRNLIGYVPQKGSLFQGTIESNLKYADENINKEDMERAIKIAQAEEFINEKPDRLESEISQGGSNVSGGQKQRLSIARALVKKAKIYIFDDSFSALDFKTDSKLRKALSSEIQSSTIFIVGQRISTIKNAEQIIVLDEGRVVGMGNHEELMEICPTYREIALSQMSEEELA
ncbi:MAG: ABC transporter ATP-binding protein/permease [Clostridium tyrobutyricum]|mgnify:FL=1|jgi:ATP-binding cassette subfamily B protein|uniref:ABC transporter ATP-binding protein n=1 Tax=Clostridium tyrobutyricum TaxID=1519 RepID=UPI00073D72CB|nr:ABC transporter ATP-binding protein [Clostridium tyrobutyricum]MBV4422306.1 ABC transporter ATP-binding protein/permease [Clostridium tyrobutyricum]MBV4430891.1 ABC transporter ATP-binding protein/permease [Clostridium tyrobutyricum]MBV4446174.1 ABC transporter ATP-binding protein/permease [Clostridium tyrobutyricum]MCH4199069.1 ABC transporter ATP-binding protein/permease [Clostridium tyrobutyricum]MCH4236781.1 ABC transporter ATP-binding protein/permease [Clostridium tyrobutyricum]